MYWEILEIQPTKDEKIIKEAYRKKLPSVNPEDDQEGFKELRRAYEEAMNYAAGTSDMEREESDYFTSPYHKKDEIDMWLERIDAVYKDVAKRRDASLWNQLMNDSVCDDLDMELEAAEKLLVYIMGHCYLPQSVLQVVDKRFSYRENMDQLKEKFAENFLDYLKWLMETPSLIDYNLFDGVTDDRVDEYINKFYEIKATEESGNLTRVAELLQELDAFKLKHPYTGVEKARYYMLKARELQNADENNDRALEKCKKWNDRALEIMEQLDFEYSENTYIERTYARALLNNQKIEEAKKIFQDLLEKKEDDVGALIGIAECVFLEGNPEKAKEQVEDVLEDYVQDLEAVALLERINENLVATYTKQLENEMKQEIVIKLGWCYYQQKQFEKGIALLDRLQDSDEYDYINIRCRLYLANDEYEKAFPYAKKWLDIIENTVDDGTVEMKKRRNRLALALFSMGVCSWEVTFRKAEGMQKQKAYRDTLQYMESAIEEEDNMIIKLSYMEQQARFYVEENAYEECVYLCDRIIEIDKGFFPAYVHRQKAYYKLRKATEVIEDYFTCIELYQEYAQPYIYAAEVFFAFEQYDDVEQVLQTAKNAGVESDHLKFFEIKCLHYKEFSPEHTKAALEEIKKLRERVYEKREDAETDIEDLEELEQEYAIICWDLDDVTQTFNIVDNYLKEHPSSEKMCKFKIDVCIREKRVKEALSLAKKMQKEKPDDVEWQMKLALCHECNLQSDKAIAIYKSILEKDKEYVPAIRRLMYVYSNLNNIVNENLEMCRLGIYYADKMIDLTGSAEAYLEKGNLQIDLYDLEGAVESCKKAIARDERAYYAYNNLGCALLKLRRVEEALPPLLQAIELDPDREHLPYMNLGECYTLLGEYDKAIEAYRQVLRLQPGNEKIKTTIVKLYMKKGEYDKAIAYYGKRIKEITDKEKRLFVNDGGKEYDEQELLTLYADLADVYRQAGEHEKAQRYYENILKHWKNPFAAKISCEHIASVAEYYRDRGELEKAEKLVTKAYWKCNDEANSYEKESLMFLTATIYFLRGNHKKAKEAVAKYFAKHSARKGTDREEELFADKRFRLANLYEFAIMTLCAGDLEAGKRYIEQMKDCKVCVTCECMECYEYYFANGFLAQLEGRPEDAKKHYEKAIQIKGDYPCAEYMLSKIEK